MTQPNLKHVIAATAALSLTACVDSKYDLSDIDTTTRIDVDNLTLPVNMNPVRLSSVLDLHDESIIREEDGQYVILRSGTFSSEAINIRAIDAAASPTERIDAQSTLTADHQGIITLGEVPHQFSYSYSNVDEYILAIDQANTDLTMSIQLGCSGGPATYTNVRLQMPRGLSGTTSLGTYNSSTGIITIANAYAPTGVIDVDFRVSAIDIAQSTAQFDTDARTFTYSDCLSLIGGKVAPTASVGQNVDTWIQFSFSRLKVNSLSGEIYYDIKDLAAEEVNFDDIPDALNQDDTHLAIANPQIYISVENPLAHYGLSASTGLRLWQVRNGQRSGSVALESPFTVGAVDGVQTFCLTPKEPTDKKWLSPTLQTVNFPSLGDIAYGDGLPQSMVFDFVNPRMNSAHVSGFLLGQNLGKVTGSYTFYAPLALDPKSQIVYSEDETGWAADVEDLTVTSITITANVDNQLPVGAVFKAWPLDEQGNIMPGVTVEGAQLSPGSQDVEIHITGNIHGLDGVRYTATVTPDDSSQVLAPGMTLTATNIKVSVSGYYQTVL
jgi:hypothetical protein